MILSEIDLNHEIETGNIAIMPKNEDTIRENGIDLRISCDIVRLKQSSRELCIASSKNEILYSREKQTDNFVIRPFEKILVATLEKITLPNHLIAFCQLRSTFARAGISIPPTIVDAGFSGNLTIQMSGSSFPVRIPVKTRFLHLIIAELKSPLFRGYNGKYQNDKGIALPKKD